MADDLAEIKKIIANLQTGIAEIKKGKRAHRS